MKTKKFAELFKPVQCSYEAKVKYFEQKYRGNISCDTVPLMSAGSHSQTLRLTSRRVATTLRDVGGGVALCQ